MKDVVDDPHGSGWATEETTCLLCGSPNYVPTRYEDGPFKLRRCADCRFWYLSPRLQPSEIDRIYRSDSYFGGGDDGSGYADYDAQEHSLRATFKSLLQALKARGATGGALLEAGSGPGYLLDEARGYFTSRVGVELSQATAARAEALAGAPVHLSLDDVPQDQQFDTIVATHVIEHIYEPVAFVRDLAQRLKPGGALVLAAPHMGSPLRHVMGRRWPSFKFPEHVSYFDATTLPDLLRRGGLTVEGRVPYPHAFPLSLILSKLALPSPGWTDRIDITLPTTTICFMARAEP